MANEYSVYRVKPGDNLALIAKAQGVSLAALKRYNPTLTKGEVTPGMQIIIYKGKESTPAPESTPPIKETPEKNTETKEPEKSKGEEKTPDKTASYTPIYKSVKSLSDEQLMQLARLATESTYLDKRQKEAAALRETTEKLGNARTDETADYESRLSALVESGGEKSGDITQSAVRQGLVRSSILPALQKELALRQEEAESGLKSAYQESISRVERALAEAERASRERAEVLNKQEANALELAFLKEKTKAEKELEAALLYNQREAAKAAKSAAPADAQNAEDALKGALSLLPKAQAAAYIKSSEEKLKGLLGSKYSSIVKNYLS